MGKKAEQAANWVGSKVEQAGNFVSSTIENIINNPLPVIETIALAYVIGPEALNLGLSSGSSAAVSSAAISAANGGDMNQIATAAVAGYAGGTAGESAQAGATSAGASIETAKIAASAAGASTATVVSAVASGQPLDKALEAGLTSGALAAGTTGVIEEAKSALAPPETGAGIKAVPGQGTQLLGDQTSVSGLGLTEKVPTGGGQGLTVDPNIILPSSLAQYGTNTGKVRGTDTGGLQPAYTSAADTLTPSSFDPTITGTSTSAAYNEPKTVTQTPEPVISKTTESLARPVISSGLSELFGLGPKVPGAPAAGGTSGIAQGATTGTTTGLTGERGAGEIESKETGKARQNVWNEASLRLKDALGV